MTNFDSTEKHLIIPVEIQSRELLAKLYFGAVGANQGFDVIVGDQKEIKENIYKLQPGIYLDKSIAKTKQNYFRKLKRLGFIPVALCEEGLVYRNKSRYIQERINLGSFNLAAYFFCWGERHKSDVLNAGADPEKLIVSGNPRFDLLRDEFRPLWNEKKNKIKQQFGPFILINTNFSRYNKLPGMPDVIDLLKKRGTLDHAESIPYYDGLVSHLQKVMVAFQKIIPLIAQKFPFHKIVIRPHPGEYFIPYESIAKGHSNIHVISDESVVPWLLAADIIIHNSCTTGVEGWLLNRPVISFMPYTNTKFDSFLPNALSYQCHDYNGLIDKITEIIKKKNGAKYDQDTLRIAQEYIFGLNGEMASDFLIRNLPVEKCRRSQISTLINLFAVQIKKYIRKIIRKHRSQGYNTLAKQKFPGMDKHTANEFIGKIIQCRPELKDVKLRKLKNWKNVFHLHTEKR